MQFLLLFVFWLVGFYAEPAGAKSTTQPVASSVKLLSFKVKTAGTKNILEWQTTSETDTREFIIETSVDGRSFDLTAWVTPKGTVRGPAFYSYIDQASNQTKYYRLRMVAANGKEQLSSIISIGRPSAVK